MRRQLLPVPSWGTSRSPLATFFIWDPSAAAGKGVKLCRGGGWVEVVSRGLSLTQDQGHKSSRPLCAGQGRR